MNLQNLISSYQKISHALDTKHPMTDKEKRVFAYITKMVEEFGELAEVSLAKANLQRDSKNLDNIQQKIADEFADVMGSLLILGIALDVDIEEAIKRKIVLTNTRLEIK